MNARHFAAGAGAFATFGLVALFLLSLPAAATTVSATGQPTPIGHAPAPFVPTVACSYHLGLIATPSHVLVGQLIVLNAQLTIAGPHSSTCVQGLSFHYGGLPPGVSSRNGPVVTGIAFVPGVFHVVLTVDTFSGPLNAATVLTVS